MKTIGEIIQGHPLFHVKSSDTVRDVAKMMSDKNVGAVAVLDSGRLVGIFSERDLMKRVVAAGLNPEKTSVVKVMTKDLVVGRPGDDINDALQKMHSIGCRHLPIHCRQRSFGRKGSLRRTKRFEPSTSPTIRRRWGRPATD